MASWWNSLREEVLGTVDSVRQKGAVAVLKDAALDARDMTADAGTWLWEGVQDLVVGGEQPEAVLRAEGLPEVGAVVTLELANGSTVPGTLLWTDVIASPPIARVVVAGVEGEPWLARVVAPGAPWPEPPPAAPAAPVARSVEGAEASASSSSATGPGPSAAGAEADDGPAAAAAAEGQGGLLGGEGEGNFLTGLVDDLKEEWRDTVQDFREKGAVGAVKDATLDAVDLVGNSAAAAVRNSRALAGPLLERAAELSERFVPSSVVLGPGGGSGEGSGEGAEPATASSAAPAAAPHPSAEGEAPAARAATSGASTAQEPAAAAAGGAAGGAAKKGEDKAGAAPSGGEEEEVID